MGYDWDAQNVTRLTVVDQLTVSAAVPINLPIDRTDMSCAYFNPYPNSGIGTQRISPGAVMPGSCVGFCCRRSSSRRG